MAKRDKHGGITSYRKGRRCDKCRVAQRDKMRRYRARKAAAADEQN